MKKHNEAEGVRENLPRMPYGVASMAEIVAVIKDTVVKAYAEREESAVQDDTNNPKGEES